MSWYNTTREQSDDLTDAEHLPPLPTVDPALPAHRADVVAPDIDYRGPPPNNLLPKELELRFDVADPDALTRARLSAACHHADSLPPRTFSNEAHDATDPLTDPHPTPLNALVPPLLNWRLPENKVHRTGQAVLALCMNVGTDPPDVVKVTPCARQLCWTDPLSVPPARCLDLIGRQLEASYQRWRDKVKYRPVVDPTCDEIKKLCEAARRAAAPHSERVLFHYSGHGVPRPTDKSNSEIWVFNERYTQYVPLSLYDLHDWVGDPAIYVFDCPGAARVLPQLRPYQSRAARECSPQDGLPGWTPPDDIPDPLRNVIVLMACQADEDLPRNPDLPADVFTSALTTPVKLALRVHAARNPRECDGNVTALIDQLLCLGKPHERSSPAGELLWILTTITDTIAYSSIPQPLFQKLYRGDLLVAALFRNFLLAERILRWEGVTPTTYPRLPRVAHHPLWGEWDRVLDATLRQLPVMFAHPSPLSLWTPSDHFDHHLDQFRNWISNPPVNPHLHPAPQLPMVLQVFLSPTYRVNALVLFARYLDMGRWAVEQGLAVGAQMYVLKLLHTNHRDMQPLLLHVWAKLLAVDPSLQMDLVMHSLKATSPRPANAPPFPPPAHAFFLRMLEEPSAPTPQRSLAAFCAARICARNAAGQDLCFRGVAAPSGLMHACLRLLQAGGGGLGPEEGGEGEGMGAWVLHVQCCCTALGALIEDQPVYAMEFTSMGGMSLLLQSHLHHSNPQIRAAACYALGCMVCSFFPGTEDAVARQEALAKWAEQHDLAAHSHATVERFLVQQLLCLAADASVVVRAELAAALARLVSGHMPHFLRAVADREQQAAEGEGEWAAVEADGGERAREQQPPEDPTQAFYAAVVGITLQLATDPAPRVAHIARAALALAGCTVSEPNSCPGGSHGSPLGLSTPSCSRPPSTSSRASSSSGSTTHPHGIGSLTSKLKSSCTAFLPSAFSAPSDRSSRSSSPVPPAPHPPTPRAHPLSRGPFHITHNPPPGHHSTFCSPYPHLRPFCPNPSALASRPPDFPASPLLLWVSHAMQRPFLRPTTTRWRDTAAPAWTRCPDPARVDARMRSTLAAVEASSAMQHPRIKEPHSVPLPSPPHPLFHPPARPLPLAALSFHHHHPLLVAADPSGLLHVMDYTKAAPPLATFHVATGAPTPPHAAAPHPAVVSIFQLNQPYTRLPESTLAACTADGAVRVWRNYAAPAASRAADPLRLATAWQAVPLPPSSHAPAHPAVFAWSSVEPRLYAAGGMDPGVVHCWDAAEERCTHQMAQPDCDALDAPPVDRLALSPRAHLLLSTAVDGTVCVYDVRSADPMVFRFRSGTADPLCGALLQPSSLEHSVVLGTQGGTIRFLDMRAAGDPVLQTVTAHSAGRMCHIAAHAHAPIMCTGTADGVVKVWNPAAMAGSSSSCRVRARDQPPSSVAALAFHPHQPCLAVADAHPGLTVYTFEDGAPPADTQLAPKPAAASASSAAASSTAA